MISSEVGAKVLHEELHLYEQLKVVNFGTKVKYVLRPIEYALEIHADFLTKYCTTTKKVVFLGMNPGPWGMMQNGVPFGECSSVRDFLRLSGSVKEPESFHLARPIQGLSCQRSEVSGKRFWSLAALLGAFDPCAFFKNAFVYNYFPFCLLDEKGKNVTPPELKGLEPGMNDYITQVCNASLIRIFHLLEIEVVIVLGRYAQSKIDKLVKAERLPFKVIYLPHPSPRNPKSNKNWLETAKNIILENNLAQYFCL